MKDMNHTYLLAGPLVLASMLGPLGSTVAQSVQKPTPLTSPAEWIRPEDYPVSATASEQAGVTGFALTINDKGFVARCEVTWSSGVEILDSTACALLRARAAFLPVKGKDGKPVEGLFRSRIIWRLPGSPDGNAAPGEAEELAAAEAEKKQTEWLQSNLETFRSETSFTVDAEGRTSECEQRFTGALGGRMTPFRCKDMPPAMPPIKNGEGKPTARRINILFGMDVEDVKSPSDNR